MKNEDIAFFNAYVQRKLGNESKKYKIYEMVLDEETSRGLILVWNVNTLDYTVITSELNTIDLIQDEVPELFLDIIKKKSH